MNLNFKLSSCRSETGPSANVPGGDSVYRGPRGRVAALCEEDRPQRRAAREGAECLGHESESAAAPARSTLPLDTADKVTARAARRTESERYDRVEAALQCRRDTTGRRPRSDVGAPPSPSCATPRRGPGPVPVEELHGQQISLYGFQEVIEMFAVLCLFHKKYIESET